MISVEEAKTIVGNHFVQGAAKHVPLDRCVGMVLAKDVVSPLNMPPFDQSAMDGYAINSNDIGQVLQLKGEIAAGAEADQILERGFTTRIFTGGAVPTGADTVVMQEHATVEGDQASFHPLPKAGANVRLKGEQIKQGEVVLNAGHKIGSAEVALLATMGFGEVEVISKPSVGILVTGNELVTPGSPLPSGGIYESNSYMLEAQMLKDGFCAKRYQRAEDTLEHTMKCIQEVIEEHDVILICGGVSVGDYDFVSKALKELGVEQLFHKVSQKPGKPVFFGRQGNKLIFGLPGNPASTMVCYYEYALPVLNAWAGSSSPWMKTENVRLEEGIKHREGRALFLKAKFDGEQVLPLDGQSSAMIRSFTDANCLIYVPDSLGALDAGELVEIHLIG